MTTQTLYQLPVDITQWHFDGQTEVMFNCGHFPRRRRSQMGVFR